MKNFKICLAAVTALLAFGGCQPDDGDGAAKISLSQTSTFDFPSETNSDYPAKTPLTVTVNNTGGAATGKVTISIDGASANSFSLSKSSIDNIAAGGSDTFTVAPVLGLEEGDYQANVHVSAKGVAEQSFGVRFVITELVISSIEITSLPTKLEYGVGEPIDLTGLVVEATDDKDNDFTLEDVEDYVVYDFSVPGVTTIGAKPAEDVVEPTKVQIVVGAAPVKEFDVKVLPLLVRARKAYGTTATIYIYANEEITDRIYPVATTDTEITLTTPEGSTAERVIRKNDSGYFAYLKESTVKMTLDGYVTVKGWATSEFGGSDAHNNNNPLFLMESGSTLEMKGHSKITGNCTYKTSDTPTSSVTCGTLDIKGSNLIVGGNAQITNNWVVNTGNNGAGVTYGGVSYFTGSTVITIKENAKISGNVSQNFGGNAYGGVFAGESAAVINIEGGEISGNSARSMKINADGNSIAGGGVIQNVTGFKVFVKGGIIKDNFLIFLKSGRGSAINVGASNSVTLSGSATITPGGAIIDEVIGGTTFKKDPGNAISLTNTGSSVFNFNIDGELSTTEKFNLDLQRQATAIPLDGLKVMRDYNGGTVVDFAGTAPGSKFTLRNMVNYSAHTTAAITGYTVGTNGTLVAAP